MVAPATERIYLRRSEAPRAGGGASARRRARRSGRPSSAGRTSSSTPTPCAGSCAPPGVGADDVVARGRARARVADPRRCSATVAAGRRRRDRPGARRRRCPPPSRRTPRTRPTAARWSRPTPCGSTAIPGPPPTALVANLPYNVSVPVLLHLLALLPLAAARAGDGAGRGRRPAGGAARLQGLRRPVGQGRLVRRRTPGRRRSAATSSGRRPTSTPGWSPGPAASRRPTTATREQVFAVVDAAFAQRRKTLRAALTRAGRLGRGGRGGPARTPASTRWPAASRSASSSSPGSPRA